MILRIVVSFIFLNGIFFSDYGFATSDLDLPHNTSESRKWWQLSCCHSTETVEKSFQEVFAQAESYLEKSNNQRNLLKSAQSLIQYIEKNNQLTDEDTGKCATYFSNALDKLEKMINTQDPEFDIKKSYITRANAILVDFLGTKNKKDLAQELETLIHSFYNEVATQRAKDCLWGCCEASAAITLGTIKKGGVNVVVDLICQNPGKALKDTLDAFKEAFTEYVEAQAEAEITETTIEYEEKDQRIPEIENKRLKDATTNLLTLMGMLMDNFLSRFGEDPNYTLDSINKGRAISVMSQFFDLFTPPLDKVDEHSLSIQTAILDAKGAAIKLLNGKGDVHTHAATIKNSLKVLYVQNPNGSTDIQENEVLIKMARACDKLEIEHEEEKE